MHIDKVNENTQLDTQKSNQTKKSYYKIRYCWNRYNWRQYIFGRNISKSWSKERENPNMELYSYSYHLSSKINILKQNRDVNNYYNHHCIITVEIGL